MKTVEVSDKDLALCGIKSKLASDLNIEEVQALINWCNWQDSDLWVDMSLQEILNVYRASAKWVDWQYWAEEDREAAHKAWNEAVIDPGNQMYPIE